MISRWMLSLLVSLLTLNVFAQNWLTDFDKASELAAMDDKPIVLVFQGSDWCAPCIKLEHEIWSTERFREYAQDHLIMLKADFPRKKKNALSDEQAKANAMLAEKYNKSGLFPLIVILNKDGDVLGETGYKKSTPDEYIDILKSIASIN